MQFIFGLLVGSVVSTLGVVGYLYSNGSVLVWKKKKV